MTNKLLICCDEATKICTKSQYKEASIWEKVKLNLHLFHCKKCGLYSKQNSTVTNVCNQHLSKCDGEHKLSTEEKEKLQSEVVERIE